LVVVIVVLMHELVLPAVLAFPVFDKTREKAHQMTCMSNLKKLHGAMSQYLQDWDDTYPCIALPDITGCRYWAQMLSHYLSSPSVFLCPSDPRAGGMWPSDMAVDNFFFGSNGLMPLHGISYAYNSNVAEQSRTKVSNPSCTFLMWDAWIWFYSTSRDPRPEPIGYDRMRTYSSDDWAWSRHNEGDDYLFCDGHVQWLKRTAVPGVGDTRWGDGIQ
jgi:prepilin-type processing-associated H-X9-DG protein